VITLAQAGGEEAERDLEKNATMSVETSPTGNMSTPYPPKEIQRRWNPGIAAMETTEIGTTHEEASMTKPENERTPD